MLPGGATADALDRKDYVDATISFVGDVATLGSIWAAWKAGRALKAGQAALRANQALVRFQAIDGAIAVARTGQAGYAVLQGENGKAAGYMGEALLRLFGIAYTRYVAKRAPTAFRMNALHFPNGASDDFANLPAESPNNPATSTCTSIPITRELSSPNSPVKANRPK